MFLSDQDQPVSRAGRPSLPPGDLVDALAAQAARVDAELARLVDLAAECKQRVDWTGDGYTFAHWLAWRCSLSPHQARQHEQLGERLAALPQIRESFARGELSYAKVSTLARIAGPDTEHELVRLAEALTAPQLQRAVGAYRRLAREHAADEHEREYLHHHWTEDGSLALRARLAAEDGALVLRALEAGREALWDRTRVPPADSADPPPDHARPSNAEALVAMADLALASAGSRTGVDRYQVVVHVDAPALVDGRDGRCELADGQPLAAETARRVACDSSILTIREHDGELLSLGRKRRTVSTPLRRALNARDRGCRFPTCTNTRFVDAHHVEHWSRGGETNLDNLLSLCHRHHRLVHEHGYTITFDHEGDPLFTNRYGVTLANVPRSPPPSPPRGHLHVDAGTCRNGSGDPMDLGLAVDALVSIASRGP